MSEDSTLVKHIAQAQTHETILIQRTRMCGAVRLSFSARDTNVIAGRERVALH